MNITDADAIIAYAKTLWLGWKPDQADADSWHRLLAKINNPDAAKIALRELKDNTDWNTPKRAQFLTLLPRTTAPAQDQDAGRQGHPGMYIQCVDCKAAPSPSKNEKGEPMYKAFRAGPGHLGEFKTLWFSCDGKIPEYNRLLAIMETFRADNERLYGGTWQLVRSIQGLVTEAEQGLVTEAEMMARLHQLRDTVPLDEQRRRRAAGEQPEAEYRGTPTRENGRAVPVRQAVRDFMAGIDPCEDI